jgi:glycosyltransferase involved in cell wall biosynthesis
MRILHITPHLPPDQAANALLPFHLGTWAREAGDETLYLAHPPRAGGQAALPGSVTWIPRHQAGDRLTRATKLTALTAAGRIVRAASPLVQSADVVHVHSNGLLCEVGALVAAWHEKPTVLTLYGTEIWHYEPRRVGPDLFTRAYRNAAHVTFYSHALSARAQEVGLARRDTTVIYPPVADAFRRKEPADQFEARAALNLRNRHVVLNVKRLHPLAGQKYLIQALGEVVRTHPDTRLVICGTGELLSELRAETRAAGVEAHVTFAGLVDNATIATYCIAADVFALPSTLEACPTVALEALASGTPVVTADSPGGVELNDLFGHDVQVVPREQPLPLATALIDLLEHKRRTRPHTNEVIEKEFRAAAVAAAYRDIYHRVTGRGADS